MPFHSVTARLSYGAAVGAAIVALSGCATVNRLAVKSVADTLSEGGDTVTSHDDPDLIAGALPFALMLHESLLASVPTYEPLLTTTCGLYTTYSFGFVAADAEALQKDDYDRSKRLSDRSFTLAQRGKNFCWRGLEARFRGISDALKKDPARALERSKKEDVKLLYWSAASLGAAISAGGLDQFRVSLGIIPGIRVADPLPLLKREKARLDAHARGRPLFARPLLVERLAVHAVGKPLHDQRPILDAGEDEWGHFDVVAEEITFGELEGRPEGLREVRDLQPVAVGQRQLAVLARVLEGAQLIDDALQFLPPKGGNYRKGVKSRPREGESARRIVRLTGPQLRHPGVAHAAVIGRLGAAQPDRHDGETDGEDTKTSDD
jgi:hypothetical protein